MSKFKAIINSSKKTLPVLRKVGPHISTAAKVVAGIDNVASLAKPFTEDMRLKSTERFKRIEALQRENGTSVTILIEKAKLEVTAENEQDAFDLLILKLNALKESKILSSEKNVKREQMLLIDKLKQIEADDGLISDYVYRIRQACDPSKAKGTGVLGACKGILRLKK